MSALHLALIGALLPAWQRATPSLRWQRPRASPPRLDIDELTAEDYCLLPMDVPRHRRDDLYDAALIGVPAAVPVLAFLSYPSVMRLYHATGNVARVPLTTRHPCTPCLTRSVHALPHAISTCQARPCAPSLDALPLPLSPGPVDLLSGKTWYAVDGGASQIAELLPVTNGIVVPSVSVAFGTLTAVTIQSLRQRQIAIRALLNKEACAVRSLYAACMAAFAAPACAAERSQITMLCRQYCTRMIYESQLGIDLEALDRLGASDSELDGIMQARVASPRAASPSARAPFMQSTHTHTHTHTRTRDAHASPRSWPPPRRMSARNASPPGPRVAGRVTVATQG